MALPPLRSLEAFRAVMRHGGFNAAAGTLGITPAAVSHRIRELERVIGAPLFERRNRMAIPTDQAQRYFEAIQEGFQRLEAATRMVSLPSGTDILTLHCSPSFAAQWLMPRLKRFIRQHPEIVVRLSSTPDAARLGDDVHDVDIQYARPVPEGCEALVLKEEFIVPLSAPDTIRGENLRPATTPFDEFTLLHSVRNVVQWQDWFAQFAAQKPVPARNMHFDRSFMAIAAASDGLGLCLESTLIAERELAEGRLVMPFGALGIKAGAHRLVWRRRIETPRKVIAFRDWIFAELAAGLQPPDIPAPAAPPPRRRGESSFPRINTI
jgi:LysR family transcriptional regulator, glycine cleavage system transcriptional activator